MRHPSSVIVGLVFCLTPALAQIGAAQSAPPPQLLENATNTAVGQDALANNIEAMGGLHNTAAGAGPLRGNTRGDFNTATGSGALQLNTIGVSNTANGTLALYSNRGNFNTASGTSALESNTIGNGNTASGIEALYSNTTGAYNMAGGAGALHSNTTGLGNVAVDHSEGANATTGSYNVYLGAAVMGTAADTNTIRIGLAYDSGTGAGQNQTFIAGVHGTQLSGPAVPVFVDANGQLGTLTAGQASGTGTMPAPLALQQVQAQQAINAELLARVAQLEARLEALAAAGARRR